MDFILSQIRAEKEINRNFGDDQQYMDYCRIEVEYACVFLLGYLWNKNVTKLDDDTREVVFRDIARPSMGSVVNICRMLDRNGDFFGDKKAKLSINEYPRIRNQNFGHGYVFKDGLKNVITELEKLSTGLFDPNCMLSDEFQIILVTDVIGDQARGVKYGTDNTIQPWRCATDAAEFKPDNVYAMKGVNDYIRLSPFIIVTRQREYYLFNDITDRMTGRTTYNQLFKTGSTSRNWPDFAVDISNDGVRRRSTNGTILNVYVKNFKEYIDTGIKKNITSFLTKNRASVCGTVWGHGGVGKTATVQSICDDLSQSEKRSFDYIVFASAKDRALRYTTGEIVDIEDPIDSYRSLVACINSTIGAQNIDEVQEIVNFEGKLLIIIDDYETFPQKEKAQIEALIRELNVHNHKVLITTRANVIIGEEFATDELENTETVDFLAKVMQSEFPDVQISKDEDLNLPNIQQRIFDITSGRPLFIFQFAHVWVQMGSLENALSYKIKENEGAIDFLFGRIFSYLTSEGKNIFRAIGHLVEPPDLTNLVGKLRYIVNMESVHEKFNRGLEELKKLRAIEVFENDFFRVYSNEIWQIMKKEYDSSSSLWRRGINSRLLQVTGDKNLNTETALLKNADAARYESRSQQEVSGLYRQILNRPNSPQDIKSKAVRNLAAYFFNKGNGEEAIGIFDEYWERFRTDPLVAKMYANYCWSEQKKEKAIRVLMNIIKRQNPGVGLLGLCLTYQSIMLIGRKENLKARLNVRDIDKKKFDKENKIIVQELKTLSEHLGKRVFQMVKASNLEELTPADRQYIATGLYQFSGICVRLHRFEAAIEICDFLLNNREFSAQISTGGCQRRREYASFNFYKQNYQGSKMHNKKQRPSNTAMSEAIRKAGLA